MDRRVDAVRHQQHLIGRLDVDLLDRKHHLSCFINSQSVSISTVQGSAPEKTVSGTMS